MMRSFSRSGRTFPLAAQVRIFPPRSTHAGLKLGGTLLAGWLLGTSSLASAAPNACGVPADGRVACTPAGNPYPTGIEYFPSQDLTIDVLPGVRVTNFGGEFGNQSGIVLNSQIPGVDGTVLTARDVEIQSLRSRGIMVQVDGVATIDNQATVFGRNFILYAQGTSATVVNSGALSGTGTSFDIGQGIYAAGLQGTATVVNSGSIQMSDVFGQVAIVAGTNGGDISVSNSGTIVADVPTFFRSARGIDAFFFSNATSQGAITIDSAGSVWVRAGALAAAIQATGQGNITVNAGGTIEATGSRAVGISVGDANGFGEINVTAANVTVTARPAAAQQAVSGVGIGAVSATGNVSVTSGLLNAQGDNIIGIDARTGSGNIVIASGTIRTAGANSGGIVAATPTGNISITGGSVTSDGPNSAGIRATGGSGSVQAGADAISTANVNSGGIVATGGSGPVSVTSGTITTTGGGSAGITATSGSGAVAVTAASVATAGLDSGGIKAASDAGAVTLQAGTIATAAEGSAGIFANSGTGAVSIVAGNVSTLGANSNAVIAEGRTVAITAQKAAAAGAGSFGISATGRDGVSLTVGSASALDREAVLGVSANGSVAATVSGAVTSATGDALRLAAATNGSLTVAAGGSLGGGRNGVLIEAAGPIAITNAGTVTGGSGLAVDARGGAATVASSGTIDGGVRLTANADRIDNSGTWNVRAASDLGAGDDTLVNSGTLNLLAVLNLGAGGDLLSNTGTMSMASDLQFGTGSDRLENGGTLRFSAAGPQVLTLGGLETLQNSGLVDLRNGRVGEALVLPGAFVGSGASRLGLDISAQGADQLQVGSASGSTQIVLTGADPSLTLGPGIVLVQASSASAPDAFTLADGAIQSILFEATLVYDPASFGFVLSGAPRELLFRLTRIQAAARGLWAASSDAWGAQLRHARDSVGTSGGEDRSRLWLQLFGSTGRHKGESSFDVMGTEAIVDVGFDQEIIGGQAGLDILGSAAGGFVLGVTAGYAGSDADFRTGGGTVDAEAVNGGVYAGWRSGGFFLNALGKVDSIVRGSAAAPDGFDVDLRGHSVGLSAETGYRAGFGNWFVEPTARLSYTRTSLDGFELPGVDVSFEDEDVLVGEVGLRAGAAVPLAGSGTLVFYGGANYVTTLSGEDRTSLSNETTSLLFEDAIGEEHVEGMLGARLAGAGRLSAFVEGSGAFGDERETYTLRLGLSRRF
jgi:hypothetical protein